MDRIKLMSMIGTLMLENPKEANQVETALLKAHSPQDVDAALSLSLAAAGVDADDQRHAAAGDDDERDAAAGGDENDLMPVNPARIQSNANPPLSAPRVYKPSTRTMW
jgi:hypothetical protein